MVILQNGQVRDFHKAVDSQFRLSGLSVSIAMAGLVTLSSCSNSTTLVDPPFVPHYRIIAELEGTPFYLVPAGDEEQQVLVALESGPVRPRFDELKAWNFASNDDTDFHIRSVASSQQWTPSASCTAENHLAARGRSCASPSSPPPETSGQLLSHQPCKTDADARSR